MTNDIKCLRVDISPRDSYPQLFNDVLGFAYGHSLPIHGLDDELPLLRAG